MGHSNALVVGEVQFLLPDADVVASGFGGECLCRELSSRLPEFLLSVTHCEPALGASPLELSFADASFQDLCSRQDALVSEYGAALTKTICCRFAVLTAAPTLEQVPMGLPVGLTRLDPAATYAIAVGKTHRLIFQALPKETAAMNDLSRITELLVIRLAPNPSTKAGQ